MVRTPAWALALVLATGSAQALVWPDVAARAQRDLASTDVGTRRAAVERLGHLSETEAGPLVLAALADADDSVRIAAADAAIALHLRGATDAAKSWLSSPNPKLRSKACELAETFPDPRTIAGLARALGDSDATVRAAAADALGHQRADESVPPLLGRLDDPAPNVRVSAIDALARLRDGRAALPLSAKVEDSPLDVRTAAIKALGALGDLRVVPVLTSALRDTNGDVQRAALRALGRLRAADAVEPIEPLSADRSPETRLAAIRALGAIGSPAAVRALVGMLGQGDDGVGPLERSPVRDALVDCGAAAIGAAAEVLEAPRNASAAASAAWVLGALGAHDHARDIVASMRRGVLSAIAALHALAGAGTPSEVAVLLEYASSPIPAVRDQALSAVGALLDPLRPDGRAVEPLATALVESDTTPQQKVQIATLLGRTGAARAAPLLVDLVRARGTELELAAIDALGMLGPTDGEKVLLQTLMDSDPALRLHAASALALAGSQHAREVLLDRLDHDEEVDRDSVLIALGGVLARYPDERAVSRLAAWLPLLVGAERDAVIQAIGRAPLHSAARVLGSLTSSPDPADRRSATALLATHRDSGYAAELTRSRLLDDDLTVRAEAAWTMGTLGNLHDIRILSDLARARATDVAANSVAAIGRIVATNGEASSVGAGAAQALCAFAGDSRPEVRANAFAGLAHTRIRCDSGAPERAALALDSDENVRAAAARAVARFATQADAAALAQCSESDRSWLLARYCHSPAPLVKGASELLVYIVPEGARAPRPKAAYCLVLADATLRLGTADRRGALFDPGVPKGSVTLCRPRS